MYSEQCFTAIQVMASEYHSISLSLGGHNQLEMQQDWENRHKKRLMKHEAFTQMQDYTVINRSVNSNVTLLNRVSAAYN